MGETTRNFSRRSLLKTGVGAAALIGTKAIGLPSSIGPDPTGLRGRGSKPKRGGNLRVGLTGGDATEEIDAQLMGGFTDQARDLQLYDSPTAVDLDAQVKLSMASELVPNATATEWVMRLRPDIICHNGKRYTADDLIYSFQRIMDPKDPKYGAPQLSTLDWRNLKKLDSMTVRFPFTSPYSAFFQVLANYNYFMVPLDYDPKHPVGTGPFKYKSFTPGVQSVFERWDEYWGGAPYVDEVTIIDFVDETSQVDALISGQVDAVDSLSAASIDSLRSEGQKVLISKTGNFTPFTMRCDVEPFKDVRVRQAMKYLIDREQMLEEVFDGYGSIGNDLYSLYDPDYDHSIPQRRHDIDKAKALLKQAGHSDLSVTLVTSAIAPGTVELATVFAEQAKAAGVHVSLQTLTPTNFYGPGYLKYTFSQDNWSPMYFLTETGEGCLPNSSFNEAHYDDARFNRLYTEALATVNASKQREIVHEMQQIYWDTGGYIIPYFTPFFDGYSAHLQGVTHSKNIPLGNFGFKNFWFD